MRMDGIPELSSDSSDFPGWLVGVLVSAGIRFLTRPKGATVVVKEKLCPQHPETFERTYDDHVRPSDEPRGGPTVRSSGSRFLGILKLAPKPSVTGE